MINIFRKLILDIVECIPILRDWRCFHKTWLEVGFLNFIWKQISPPQPVRERQFEAYY